MRVSILLATYNGAQFLPAQLASLAAQSHSDWELWVGDDGSTDGTLPLIHAFAERHKTTMVPGPRQGYVANFLNLCRQDALAGDLIAFCDQDDVWHNDKLQRAVVALQAVDPSTPALYGSSSRYIDEQDQVIHASVAFTKPMGFRNALVQCFAGGNTMVMNRPALELVRKAATETLVSHDWWFYQLISGAGGTIIYDPNPSIDYRQHGSNLMGGNRGLRQSLLRVQRILQGGFRAWNDMQAAALQNNRALLTAENQTILAQFEAARTGPVMQRLAALRAAGIYRQTRAANIAMWLAALTNRL